MPLQKRKITAGIVTTMVLLLLIMAGPAQAFSLTLDVDGEDSVEQGKKIELTAKVNIDSGEALDIENITLVLKGPEHRECVFDITGKMKSGVNDACHGINIKKIPYPQIEKGYGYSYGYGYGYGYTEQELVYEITIHTQKFEVGNYSTELKITFNGNEFSQQGDNIEITEKKKGQEKKEEQGIISGGKFGCTTNWECSEWGECKNGEQKRTCKKDKACITVQEKPEEKRECAEEAVFEEPLEVQETTEQPSAAEEKKEEKEEKIPGKSRSSLSRITGAVAAVGENKSWIVSFFIGGVVAAGILTLQYLRKRMYRKKFFSYKGYKMY